MPIYSVSVSESDDLATTLRFARVHSDRPMSQLRESIDRGSELVSIDSEEFSPDLDPVSGMELRHAAFLDLVTALRMHGDRFLLSYRPSHADSPEEVSLEELKNLMYSEGQARLR